MNVQFKKVGRDEVAILLRKDYEADRQGSGGGRGRRYGTAGGPCAQRDRRWSAVDPESLRRPHRRGENPVRVFRDWKDVTQMHLAFKTKLGQGYISDLENGRRKGTIKAMKRIAAALGIPLDLLV